MSSDIGGRPTNPVVAALPPQWVDDVDGVNGLLKDITRLMGMLTSMHATRVGSVFGNDLDDMEVKIESFTREITGEELASCSHGFRCCFCFGDV